MRTVGVDYLSVAAYGGDAGGVHRALLSAGVWIIEGLDLSAVTAGSYELICLPFRNRGQRRGAGACLVAGYLLGRPCNASASLGIMPPNAIVWVIEEERNAGIKG